MNLNKHYEFFQPEKCDGRVHIIGCGAIGSSLAELIARTGIKNIVLYDFDVVESKNIANQIYRAKDIGRHKTEALKEIMAEINPELERTVKIETCKYEDQQLDGYVFLAVDSIETRKEIVKKNKFNPMIKAVFDFRMRLEDAQHYAADWSDVDMKDNLFNTMDFTSEEAKSDTPRSACNEELSIAPTIRNICGFGVSNFMNFLQGKGIKKMILMNAFTYEVDAF